MDTHSEHSPQRKRISPWADRSEQRRASARKYSDLRDELGSIFRDAQQEAQAQWSAWDKEMDAQEEGNDKDNVDIRLAP